MARITDIDVKAYTSQLQACRYIPELAVEKIDKGVLVCIASGRSMRRLKLDVRPRPLTPAQAEQLLSQTHRPPVLIATPHLSASLAAQLGEAGINFIDLAGNLHLELGPHHVIHIEGRRPTVAPTHRSHLGRTEAQVLFALLCDPEAGRLTVRALSEIAGLGKSAAATALQRLCDANLIVHTQGAWRVAPGDALSSMVGLYETVLRPKLLVGRYAAMDRNPVEVEKQLAQRLNQLGARWAFGGHAAAARIHNHYRGTATSVVVEDASEGMASALRLVAKQDGEIWLMQPPGPLAFGLAEHIVHPLLAYLELLCHHDDRTREAAEALRVAKREVLT